MPQTMLERLRASAGKTVKDMAGLCGVTPKTYSKWEKDTDYMPHGMYVRCIEYLEIATRMRKEAQMPTDYGKKKVEFQSVKERIAYDREHPYTVPIPEGLTEFFKPSQPVTIQQMLTYERTGREPYPGYDAEMRAWEDAWEKVNDAQDEADGVRNVHLDLPPRHPETDIDGNLIEYDEPALVVEDDGSTRVVPNRPDPTVPESLPTEAEVEADIEAHTVDEDED